MTACLLIEQAAVDAYDDDEQLGGFHCMIEEHLALPFTTIVLGMPVQVTGVELPDAGGIVADFQRGKAEQRMPILDLPLPTPLPKGSEWIAAYRRWSG